MSKKVRREIALITTELQTALKREAIDIIAIGGLLIEARAQLKHGEWLPWLKENFGSSTHTAENYMAAAHFGAKFETVSNLKLRPTALYRLGRELDNPTGLYGRTTIKAILKAAETEWINEDRADEIARSLQPPEPPKTIEEEIAAETAAQSEIDDILEGPPPELPPAPEATVHDVILPPFDQAVTTLAQLQTKPLASFAASTHQPHNIRAVIVFLQEVADEIERQKAAAQPQEQAHHHHSRTARGQRHQSQQLADGIDSLPSQVLR
jgi:DUF3102 family protein